jgi:N-acetylmuramic acid 6-phosphate etherase
VPKKVNLPATEQRNPWSRGLDLQSSAQIAHIMNREDARVAAAVRKELRHIARAIDVSARALRAGGRLIYVGAGTSGRLAVLDASEIPPTFGVPRSMVQGVIAGGRRALTNAVEGAEDDFARGAQDLRARRVSSSDVVVGLTASGSTPYVLGALDYARKQGARTIAIACNKGTRAGRAAQIAIEVATGPEVVAGSTRLKAGTAQKLVLNMLSTAVMVRLGHVYDNWMINVARSNKKLRRRAARILTEATGAGVAEAQQVLRHAQHDVRVALLALLRKVNTREAGRMLKAANSNVRLALARR